MNVCVGMGNHIKERKKMREDRWQIKRTIAMHATIFAVFSRFNYFPLLFASRTFTFTPTCFDLFVEWGKKEKNENKFCLCLQYNTGQQHHTRRNIPAEFFFLI